MRRCSIGDRNNIPSIGVARPSFLTTAMWFVWLLRSDIRGDAAPTDLIAQREFVSWWLVWARAEYPAVFSWTRQHAGIAMELVPIENGLFCPRLLAHLHNARSDLKATFSLDNPEDLADYYCWYRLNGPMEIAAAPALPKACLALTEQPSKRRPWSLDGTRVPRIAVALSRFRPDVLPGSVDHPGNRMAVAAWYRTDGCLLIPPASLPVPAPPALARKKTFRNDGVNLIGFVSGRSGLGEDVRMVSAGLSAVAIPHVLIEAGADTREPRFPQMQVVFARSIYCMSAFDMATLYLKQGPAFFAGQYRIGYWPWELPRFPEIWTDVYQLVHEIWTGSEFTADAYRRNFRRPVRCLPAPVVVPPGAPVVRRRTTNIHRKGVFVFTYPFDPKSYMARKNPIALVRAFHLAFPRNDRAVALLLRVNGIIPEGPERTALLHEIDADPRIVLREGTLDRAASLAITAACDCLVSPHRSEGFGRNIAEAILLKVPVLATAFSGCEDFLAPNEGVAFSLLKVRPGQYPFADGLSWAEPDVIDLVAKMQTRRKVLRDPTEQERLAFRAAEFDDSYAPEAAGRGFLDRLKAVGLVLSVRAVSPSTQWHHSPR
jgi:glycosyltransferase involved in cell wall biosynthesis